MTLASAELNIASEFTTTPGPRHPEEGEFSGEAFLEALLLPRFDAAVAARTTLTVNLDGAAGYPTSFLEAAFGGLSRQRGTALVEGHLKLICTDEPYLEAEIQKYIREASK